MAERSNLTNLLGAYFHQDYFELTGDDVSTVRAFCVENPGRALGLADDIADVLTRGLSEDELAAFAQAAGCAIDPRLVGETHRQWFTEIEAQARAYAAEHPET